MVQTLAFPDIEDLLATYLTAVLGVPVGTRAATVPEFVRVIRTGGPAPTRVTDSPQITIEAYGKYESDATALLGRARRALADLPGGELNGWSVKSYDEFGGPANLPDPSSKSHRYTLTAVIQVRGKQPI